MSVLRTVAVYPGVSHSHGTRRLRRNTGVHLCVLLFAASAGVCAQTSVAPPVTTQPPTSFDSSAAPSGAPATTTNSAATPAYVIGPDDELSIVFWREKDMSADVVVRSDGKISLPLLNDIQAAGTTPLQLRAALEAAAARFIEDPVATVVVTRINSRKVFITGMVEKPGAYPLTGPMTTLQLIATAGGFRDFADTNGIVVVRRVGGHQQFFRFNYDDVAHRKRQAQDIELQPGDTVIVP